MVRIPYVAHFEVSVYYSSCARHSFGKLNLITKPKLRKVIIPVMVYLAFQKKACLLGIISYMPTGIRLKDIPTWKAQQKSAFISSTIHGCIHAQTSEVSICYTEHILHALHMGLSTSQAKVVRSQIWTS